MTEPLAWPPDARPRPRDPARISFVVAWIRHCLGAPGGAERRARAQEAPAVIRDRVAHHVEDYLWRLRGAFDHCRRQPDPAAAVHLFPPAFHDDLMRALRRPPGRDEDGRT